MSDNIEIRISKEVLDDLPADFEETRVGDPRGSRRQYRSSKSKIHAREYDDEYLIHVDRIDPRHQPLLHLAVDSPETIGAIFCANRLLSRNSHTFIQSQIESGPSFVTYLLSFLFLNSLFRTVKHILRALI
jgi:hypothetical protein